MPLYEYECTSHGGFEMLRSVSEYASPAPCPDCGTLGARVVSLPGQSYMAKTEVIARDRNERSSHEPRVSGHKPGAHVHGPGCNHSHAPAPKKTGLQQYGGKRPWVMEHG